MVTLGLRLAPKPKERPRFLCMIGRDRVVRGDLIMHKKRGFSFGFGANRKPKITIEAGATVEGRLRFEREVELSISPEAKVQHADAVEG